MSVNSYSDLVAHVGHKIVVVTYADNTNVAIECESCSEVLLDYDDDKKQKVKTCENCFEGKEATHEVVVGFFGQTLAICCDCHETCKDFPDWHA